MEPGREPSVNRASSGGAPPAVALRALGALELSGPGPIALADLLTRPKPLGLLLYLALADETGSQRRDTLLGLFWPDSDTERARSSLRQAVYQLRRGLGAGAIVGRGEEVGLAAGALTCDASEFLRRTAVGDATGALALYRGDLLPGFFVEGAPDFALWLDERRRHLRDTASAAACALADAAEQAGDAAGALAWSRRAAALAPDDEPSARRLITLLARAHDRAAALREYDAFAHRLREHYGLEPTADTTALVSAMRERGASDAPAVPPLDARRVLVTVFENATGDAALDPFGRLMADAVAQGVTQLDGVQVVPLTAALVSARHVGTVAPGAPGATRARLHAEETGAGTVVSGAYYAAGAELVVQGWIGDARTGRVLRALGPARAPMAGPLGAVEALREEACTALARQFETRVVHVRAAGRAPSYEAHIAYVEGLSRFVDGDWPGALRHLERAVAGDAAYALPLVVSAIVHWNLGELAAAERAAVRASPLVVGAGPFERAVLDMVRAWLAGDWSAAHEAVRRQSELAPGSIPSFQVAEEARRRNRPREALRVLAALDPSRGELRGWIFYWVVTTQALHMLGEHARELEVARRARELHPESMMALRLEIHARAALGDVPGVRACIDESLVTPARQEPRPGALMREAAHELRAHGHEGDTAVALLRQSLAWYQELSGEERERPAVLRALARAHYDVGDWAGATAGFTAVAGDRVRVADCGAIHHPQLQAHLDHGYLGVLAIRRGDAGEATRIEALLAGERGAHLFGSTYYWRAAMAALRGDAEVAVGLLRRAFAAGMPYEPFIHADPHFAAIRGTAAFSSILAPRG
jgi:DNA-binding SARP family transcriptional activator